MADSDSGTAGQSDSGQGDSGQEEARPQLSITAQYIKDLSFENPNAPQSLAPPHEQPQIDIGVKVESKPLAPMNYEVSLHFNVTAKQDSSTLFVVELDYGAVCALQNVPEENVEAVCMVECARLIFPFARRVIADATRDGGFPPMLIGPIDFATLYRQGRQRAQVIDPPPAQQVAQETQETEEAPAEQRKPDA